MAILAVLYVDGDASEADTQLHFTNLGRAGGIPNFNTVNFNQAASSARVFPGFRLRCFTNLNYTGQELRLDKDPQFGRANFIPGEDGVMLFTKFPDSDGFRFNDNISSAYVESDGSVHGIPLAEERDRAFDTVQVTFFNHTIDPHRWTIKDANTDQVLVADFPLPPEGQEGDNVVLNLSATAGVGNAQYRSEREAANDFTNASQLTDEGTVLMTTES